MKLTCRHLELCTSVTPTEVLSMDEERTLADSISADAGVPLGRRLRMLCVLRWKTFYNHGGYRYARDLPRKAMELDASDPTLRYSVDDFMEDALLSAARNGVSRIGVNGEWVRWPVSWGPNMSEEEDADAEPLRSMLFDRSTIVAPYGPLGPNMGDVYEEAERFDKLKGAGFFQFDPMIQSAYFQWFDWNSEGKFDDFPLKQLLEAIRKGVPTQDLLAGTD